VEFKRELAVAACGPGISVAKLALAHGLNTNLLFKWRRQYRAGRFGVPDPAHAVTLGSEPPTRPPVSQASPVRLLPVVEIATDVGVGEATGPAPACIEVVFACATVRICGVPESASLRAVLNCLARCR
jgi:transposase